ncbi:centromere DNA-binding like protein [Nitzschia inconspicua]|uniref:Centromere DNA-binding like protein n=1 Tax=Nitzschia inconspicua TaxID=303405 RepID=A0A9K3LYK4_9STRA|nr:centromere DNA-binding like protein [Nitzschia inconspicua]KAG7370554.1 centromere DNA-binding like protein [Nitzschia inconspicua]
MQSSGAHARQMDADFDDNSMANNDGLGVHPHHFNSAEAQICEAQAQQQPTRPNVGTHMLNNQRRRQERNMYLAVRPPPPPTANLLHLHSAVRSIQHGTRKDNTKKAYDRKTQEYREFVHCKFSFQDPYQREVVEHEKVYSFMFYCCFRENKVGKKAPKKPKNAPLFDEQEYDQVLATFQNQPRDGPRLEPKHGLKASAIQQYKCAIKKLHQLQQDEQRNTIPWEQIWTLKCTELHNMVKQRRNRQDRANCVEKIDHDTPYETKEHINKMEKSFWMEGMNVPSQTVFRSLRDRFCFLMTVNAILRGESLFMAELSDLYGIGWIGDDGYDHNPFWILMLQMRTGKTNGSNLKLYGRAGRHKDPTMCPMGALAFYLFYRFHKTKEMDPPPNFCESSSWFSMKLLVDYNGGKNRDYFTSISDESYRSVVKAHLEKNNIHSSHLVHIGRKWGSYLAQLQGDDWEDVRILGNWDPNTQDKSYSIKIPVKQVRSMAGWRRADQFHYNVRAEVIPPEDLRNKVFPWLEGCQEKVKTACLTGGTHPTASQFLDLMSKLSTIVIQDAAAILVSHPDRALHKLFSHPLFASKEFEGYTQRMRSHLENHQVPVNASIDAVLPGINARLDLVCAEQKAQREMIHLLQQQREEDRQMMKDMFVQISHDLQHQRYLFEHLRQCVSSKREMLAATFFQLGAEQLVTRPAPVPFHCPTSPQTPPRGSNNHQSVRNTTRKSPLDGRLPCVQPDGFNHVIQEKHCSVQNMYNEWFGLEDYEGIPVEGGIRLMETRHKSKWRNNYDAAASKRFSRLKIIVDTIVKTVAESSDPNVTTKSVIALFEEQFQAKKRSPSALITWLEQEGHKDSKKRKLS